MSLRAKLWTGLVIVVAAVGTGTYIFVERSHGPVVKRNMTPITVNIDKNCKVDKDPVHIDVDNEQEVHWQAASPGTKITFSSSPFQDGSIFVVDANALSVDSGWLTDEAEKCPSAVKPCEYAYTVTVKGAQCMDPKVIVSR